MILSAAAYALLDSECNNHDNFIKFLEDNELLDDDDDKDYELLLLLLSEISRGRSAKFLWRKDEFRGIR